jgi:hypothetical protein
LIRLDHALDPTRPLLDVYGDRRRIFAAFLLPIVPIIRAEAARLKTRIRPNPRTGNTRAAARSNSAFVAVLGREGGEREEYIDGGVG